MRTLATTQPLFERSAQSWLAVASAEHVARGQSAGFMQVCHGKGGPLKRLQAGDRVVYYSPTGTFGGKDRLQAFTAIGQVSDRAPYLHDMGGGFVPFRRDVAWWPSQCVPIAGLLQLLDLTRDNKNWGYSLRFGLLRLSEADMDCIAAAMCAAGTATSDRQVECLGGALQCG